LPALALSAWGQNSISGKVIDAQGHAIPGATVRLAAGGRSTGVPADVHGRYRFDGLAGGVYEQKAESPGLSSVTLQVTVAGRNVEQDIPLSKIVARHDSIVITGNAVQPEIDLRNTEVFNRTLFTRDHQVLQQLNAGINAGQQEGGVKSLEIRRFGFNLDHGGVNGGLKVMLDGVQQNQGTQGHGQGYLVRSKRSVGS
jgi:hypothetical protein